MDEAAAREAFERAVATQEPEFGKFFLARFYGCEFEYTDEECRITFDIRDFMHNPRGGLHGGVIAFVMDISMGHLLRHRSGPGATLELKIQYLKAPKSGRMTCTARFLRHGRGVSFLRSELVDEQGELVAFATSTWKSLSERKAHGHAEPAR